MNTREFVVCLRDAKGGTQTVIHRATSAEQARKDIERWYPRHAIVSID